MRLRRSSARKLGCSARRGACDRLSRHIYRVRAKHSRASPSSARLRRQFQSKRTGQPSSLRLRQQHHKSDWICGEIANGEAPRLQKEPESPFEPGLLQPARSTRLRARDEIEQPTRCLDYLHVGKASRVARDEFLFQRHAKREPQYVGARALISASFASSASPLRKPCERPRMLRRGNILRVAP